MPPPVQAAPTTVDSIDIRSLTVSFGGVRVLKDVSTRFMLGRIYGLLGQNGSGKSTLVKTLAGAVQPEHGGTLVVCGEEHRLPLSPDLPLRLGFGFVHQHLPLARELTVYENLVAGRYRTRLGKINWRHERRRAQDTLDRFQIRLPLEVNVGSLSPGQRALLSVVAAFSRAEAAGSPRLLVLDEVTTYLPAADVERVLQLVASAAAEGIACVLVSHRLREVFRIADTVVVLRDGNVCLNEPTAKASEVDVVQAIVGEELARFTPAVPASAAIDTTLSVRQLCTDRVGPLSFDLRNGKVFGLTGLQGSGYETLPYLLYGFREGGQPVEGTLRIGDEDLDLARLTPRGALARGITLVPRDRLRLSVVASATVAENYSLPQIRRFFQGCRLHRRVERQAAKSMLERFAVMARSTEQILGTLSGGNQQRVVMGKWLDTHPNVLLLDEPTQGVDVRGRADIWLMIHAQARGGLTVLVCAEAAEELAANCDEVIVMSQGQITTTLSGKSITEQTITAAQHGVSVEIQTPTATNLSD